MPSRPGLPPAVAFVLRNAAIGGAIGIAMAVALLLTDAGGLRSLITQAHDPLAPLLLLAVGFATLIGGLYTAAALMMLRGGDDDAGR